MSKALKPVASTPTLSIAHWPSQKKVQKLADRLDLVVDAEKGMIAAKKELARRPSDAALLVRAKKEADFYTRHVRSEITSSELAKLKKECDPKGWWEDDDDGDVRQSEVAKIVAMLVGSWPTSNIPEPTVYVQGLIEDVMALNPSFVVLESACRKLRRELKFMPSIAEVVAEIEEQKSAWHDRMSALLYIDLFAYENLVKQIAESEAAIAAAEERRERQRKYLEAKAAPLVVGDRVRHRWLRLGVITKPWGPGGWLVLFDNNREDARLAEYMDADCLEKLVEGDEGFEPPSRPALAYQPLVPMPCVDAQPAAALVATAPEPKSERVKE
jgi:hypothetical protein